MGAVSVDLHGAGPSLRLRTDRPVSVLTRGPVADRIQSVVVAALTRTKRDLVPELRSPLPPTEFPATVS